MAVSKDHNLKISKKEIIDIAAEFGLPKVVSYSQHSKGPGFVDYLVEMAKGQILIQA